MYNLLHSKTAAALGTWLTLVTILFAWVGSLIPDWFGKLSLPKMVLLGFVAALTTTLFLSSVLALLGYAFRKFKPVDYSAPPIGEHQSLPAPYDDSDTRQILADHEKRLSTIEISYPGNVSQLGRDIDQLKAKVDENYDFLRPVLAAERADAAELKRFTDKLELGRIEKERFKTAASILGNMEHLFEGLVELAKRPEFSGDSVDLSHWRQNFGAHGIAYDSIVGGLRNLGMPMDIFRNPARFIENPERPVPVEHELIDVPREILLDIRRLHHERAALHEHVDPIVAQSKAAYLGAVGGIADLLKPLEDENDRTQ